MQVLYSIVRARDVVNLTSPRLLPEIALHWKGKHDWYDERYEPVRNLIERTYVNGFDEAVGHYTRLEESILKTGVLNPVLLVTGGPWTRATYEMPPPVRRRTDVLISERIGGSRLYIAAKHDMTVPAVINDHGMVGVLSEEAKPEWTQGRLLKSLEEVAACFSSQPAMLKYSLAEGVRISRLPYIHMDDDYDHSTQMRVRRGVVAKVKREVAEWMRKNDH